MTTGAEPRTVVIELDGAQYSDVTLTASDGEWLMTSTSNRPMSGEFSSSCTHAVIPLPYGTVILTVTTNSLGWSYATPRDTSDLLRRGVTHLVTEAGRLVLVETADLHPRDPFAPAFHLCPPRGWLNDPNGLVSHRGFHHAFFQFNPLEPRWGPMHWGHLISADLVHWTYLPILLWPHLPDDGDEDYRGGEFSGSALSIEEDLKVWYTRHVGSDTHRERFRQWQMSTRVPDAVHATPPQTVVASPPPGIGPDFRDPKVICDPDSGDLRMILGATDDGEPAVVSYLSRDQGESWTYRGVLYRPVTPCRTIECPDLMFVDGEWVLVAALLGSTDEAGRMHVTHAMVGDLYRGVDSDEFIARSTQTLDFAGDFYAFQSYDAGDRRLGMAWLANWRDLAGIPVDLISGQMTTMREVRIREGRVVLPPVPEIGSLRTRGTTLPAGASREGLGNTFEVNVRGESTSWRLHLSRVDGRQVSILRNRDTIRIVTPEDGDMTTQSDIVGDGAVRVLVDRRSVEVIADFGAVTGCRLTPSLFDGCVLLQSDDQQTYARLRPMRSIWKSQDSATPPTV